MKTAYDVAVAHGDKWRKRAAKHTRADGHRSDLEQADLERAKICYAIAADLAKLERIKP
jgi:hypothetical protein